MKRVAVDSIPIDDRRPGRRILTDAVGASHLGINHYRLAPGEAFGGGYHAHHDQEELFYVIEGEATFRTEAGTEVVGADELVRFAPGEFQHGFNGGDEPLTALGFGAPQGSKDVEVVRACEECGHVFNLRRSTLLGQEGAPDEVEAPCPECEGPSRRIDRPD